MNKSFCLILAIICISSFNLVKSELKEFDQEMVKPIFDDNKPALILFHKKDDKTAFPIIEAAEKDVEILLVHSEPGSFGDRVIEFFGVKEADFPTVLILHALGKEEGTRKYKLEEELTTENIVAFYNKFKNNELKSFLKSDEIPAEPKKDGVVTIVGKTFKDIVLNNEKDILVKFYAPWCGHCKSMQPDYIKLAKSLEENPNIVIAEMDSTTNECDEVTVNSFPTLKFFPGNKKSEAPLSFNGGRTLEGMTTYLKEHAVHAFETGEIKKEEL